MTEARAADGEMLSAACGGMRLTGFPLSRNVDRVNDANLWTPTEDGRVVGPQGQWTWDPTINANQPDKIYSATETGELIGPGGREYVDPGLGSYGRVDAANAEYASPRFEEFRSSMSDAINFRLSPTEDGKLVGSNGRVYDDPSINENQNVYTHKPGEFVAGVHENEAAPNGYTTWPMTSPAAGDGVDPGMTSPMGGETTGGLPSGGADEAGFIQAFGGNENNTGFGAQNEGGFQSSSADESGFVQAFGNEGTGSGQGEALASNGADESGFVDAFGGE